MEVRLTAVIELESLATSELFTFVKGIRDELVERQWLDPPSTRVIAHLNDACAKIKELGEREVKHAKPS